MWRYSYLGQHIDFSAFHANKNSADVRGVKPLCNPWVGDPKFGGFTLSRGLQLAP